MIYFNNKFIHHYHSAVQEKFPPEKMYNPLDYSYL